MRSISNVKSLTMALGLLALSFSMTKAGHAADASNWPDKPIRVVVGFAPGGGADIVARILTTKMADEIGQSFIVENRPGATGQIAASAVARAAPDGYTLMLDATAFSINPTLYKNLPYDTKAAFTPISLIVKFPLLAIKHNKFAPENIKELIEYTKANPGEVSYGSSGLGSVQHLATALFEEETDTQLLHVPYKGGSQSVSDLAGGQIQLVLANGASSLPFVLDKRVTALATTGAKRSNALPDVPTMEEAGVPGFQAYEWTALIAPEGTPTAIIEKLSTAARNALNSPDVKKQLEDMGGEIVGATPVETAKFIQGEMDHWAEIIEKNNIKVE